MGCSASYLSKSDASFSLTHLEIALCMSTYHTDTLFCDATRCPRQTGPKMGLIVDLVLSSSKI